MFGTSGVRGRVGETVTARLALSVGRAVAAEGADRVVVGRDPRESGRALADAASAGLRESGADVVRLGLAATPTVARGVGWLDADAGVVVTASHNPPADNGLKLWTPSGRAFGPDRREAVARRVREDDYDLASADGHGREQGDVPRTSKDASGDSRERADLQDGGASLHDRHVAALGAAGGDLSDLSVVVDVGNGAGGVTADALDALGADVTTLNARPDGRFPGRPSEPTAEHCTALRTLVGGTDADLGVAHDGDADRMRAVAADGSFVGGDALLALFARAAMNGGDGACENDGDRVAVPVDASLAVDDAVAAAGGSVVRTPVGDVYVAERAAEPDVAFGGEPSGAWIWPDETLCPDGPLAAVKLATLVARRGPLADLLATVDIYPIRRETVATEAKAAVMDAVCEQVVDEGVTVGAADDVSATGAADISTMDGVRVGREDGWFLVRASGTEPLVRLTAEAREPARADDLLAEVRDLVAAAMNATAARDAGGSR